MCKAAALAGLIPERGCLCKEGRKGVGKAKAKEVESKEGDWLRENKERAKGYVRISVDDA